MQMLTSDSNLLQPFPLCNAHVLLVALSFMAQLPRTLDFASNNTMYDKPMLYCIFLFFNNLCLVCIF